MNGDRKTTINSTGLLEIEKVKGEEGEEREEEEEKKKEEKKKKKEKKKKEKEKKKNEKKEKEKVMRSSSPLRKCSLKMAETIGKPLYHDGNEYCGSKLKVGKGDITLNSSWSRDGDDVPNTGNENHSGRYAILYLSFDS
ncbi:Hypothetical predicted protein [Octopus vulgaris]|uniref:Uncharacterized protein n=1 Tax=Octopus vulgaris TaxID=6645 RepID=A0AA36AW40_OCTVU|nr:Hypothetical predicted protein [Octopus vulgaris]